MVARPSGELNRHRGFQNIHLPNPVFTVENSADNYPIHIKHNKFCTHNMQGIKSITAEHSPTARPAELHKMKPVQCKRISVSVLNIDWLQTSSCTEKLSN